MKSLLTKMALILGSIFIVLLCIEIVLSFSNFTVQTETWRVRGIFQLDKDLVYSLKPDIERTWESGGFVEYVKTNRFGLRDDKVQDKTNYEKRILVLGDSMTFGHRVNGDEAFPNQLEKIFKKRGRKIDVINAGIKGYGTDQSYKFFTTRLRSLKPDLVIFAINMNDVFDNINLPLYTIEDEKLVPVDARKNWLYISARVYNFLPKFIQNRNLPRFIFERLANRDWFHVRYNIEDKELFIWSIKKIYLELAQLQKIADNDNFKLLVVGVPYKDNIREAFSWLEKDGIWLFNAHKDDIWREQADVLFFEDDNHFSIKGNEVLAKKLYEFLKQSGF